ncbi:MAG: hypothetical protein U0105_14950 [Candidatus Obscuribacterales bacterium]
MDLLHQGAGQWFWLLAIMGGWVIGLSMMGAHGVFFADKNIEEDTTASEAGH